MFAFVMSFVSMRLFQHLMLVYFSLVHIICIRSQLYQIFCEQEGKYLRHPFVAVLQTDTQFAVDTVVC